jgi:Metallo-peptidase family M12B Reprolysin-like
MTLSTMFRCTALIAVSLGFALAAAPTARAHGLEVVEALDPLPPAASMVPVEGAGLFSAVPGAATPEVSGGFVERSRLVQFDAGYRDRMLLAPAVGPLAARIEGAPDPVPASVQVFTLPLFDDIAVKVYKTGAHQDNLGSTIWTGRVLDADGGEALLTFHAGHVTGSVRVGARMFSIQPTADGQTRISESNPSLRPHADPLTPPHARTAAPPPKPQLAEPSTVNILVAYTPAAAANTADITGAISNAIAYTNMVMSNSQIPTQMNLVGTMAVDYTEPGDTATMPAANQILQDATYGIGGFGAVHDQRDALKADLVSVWTVFDQYCGLSWILEDADQNDDQAVGYNVISNLKSYNGGCLTDAVAHEIGHNFGSKHDRYEDDPSDQLTSQFNFGYVDVANRFMTIMSYPNECEASNVNCAVIPYHSTLALTYQGHPLGIGPDSAPNAADNTTKIKEIAPYIAQFRSQAPTAIAAPLVDSILPSSRSVQVNDQATFFMTVINTANVPATNCQLNGLQYADSSSAGFSYNWIWQTTNPATNQPTGTPFAPVTIPANNGIQTFYAGVTFSTPITASFQMQVGCDNADTASIIPGVNTLALTVDSNPVPDIIALSESATHDGIIHVPSGGSNAFAVATTNLGIAGNILISVDTGSITEPVSLGICQTNPSTAQCLSPPTSTVVHDFSGGETPTFSVFATATGPIAANAATNRVFVNFNDASGGTLRGSTSVAIQSP